MNEPVTWGQVVWIVALLPVMALAVYVTGWALYGLFIALIWALERIADEPKVRKSEPEHPSAEPEHLDNDPGWQSATRDSMESWAKENPF